MLSDAFLFNKLEKIGRKDDCDKNEDMPWKQTWCLNVISCLSEGELK
jgi:hypothetical protein